MFPKDGFCLLVIWCFGTGLMPAAGLAIHRTATILGFGLKLTGSNILQAPPPNVHKTNNKTDHDKQLTFSGPQ